MECWSDETQYSNSTPILRSPFRLPASSSSPNAARHLCSAFFSSVIIFARGFYVEANLPLCSRLELNARVWAPIWYYLPASTCEDKPNGMSVGLYFNQQRSRVAPGLSLFDYAESLGIRVPTSCRKNGHCKECVVEITEGTDCLSPPAPPEAHLRETSASPAVAGS